MKPKRIMVIDHYPAFLDLMKDLLPEEGYEVIPLLDGNVEYTYTNIQEQHPELVILEIPMQAHDVGMAVLNLIRLNPKTRPIPVIVCSADIPFLREQESNLEQLGCCILPKPFDLASLLDTIKKGLASES